MHHSEAKIAQIFSWRVLVVFAIAAGVFNAFPLFTVTPYGDVIQNYMLSQCFSEQVWSGHLYPRWCMNANLGLGTPRPIFYFPIPFYITALFYPLKSLGLSNFGQYILAIMVCNTVTFVTSTYWLKHYTSFRAALFCSFLLLWMPYRMEVEVFRASYAELWGMAFLPLIFLWITQLHQSPLARQWPKLSLAIAFGMLFHAPIIFAGLMAAGVMIVVLYRANLKFLLFFGCCAALAYMATAFHFFPASILSTDLNEHVGSVEEWKTSWASGYFNEHIDKKAFSSLMTSTGILAALSMMITFFIQRRHIDDLHIRRMAYSAIAAGLFGLFMMMSYSDFLWRFIILIIKVPIAWRMAVIVDFSAIWLIAIGSRYLPAIRNRKQGDYWALAFIVIFLGAANVSTVGNSSLDELKKREDAQIMFGYMVTHWMDETYASDKGWSDYYSRFVNAKGEKRAELTKDGTTHITGWGYDGLTVKVNSNVPNVLTLNQFYFPIWQGFIDNAPTKLFPEKNLGRISVAVPAGEHSVTVVQNMQNALPGYFLWICIMSFVSFVIMLGGLCFSATGCKRLCGTAAIN